MISAKVLARVISSKAYVAFCSVEKWNFCKYPEGSAGKILVFPTHHYLDELIRTAVLELTFCISGIFFLTSALTVLLEKWDASVILVLTFLG